MCDNLNQQAVIIGGNLCACVGCAAIQTDTVAGRGTIYVNLACIGHEIVCRVFRCDTQLHGIAVAVYILLRGNADFGRTQRIALLNQNLCLYDINTGYLLGNGMLYLNTRVHFDEVVVFIGIHQKFQCAGVLIAYMLGQTHRIRQNFFSDRLAYGKGRRKFDYLLVSSLHGTVTVKQMHHIAVFIAKHLYFDMLGVTQIFFYENFIITEGLLCFVSCFFKFLGHFLFGIYNTHTATAAAVGCLQHNGIADLPGNLHYLIQTSDCMVNTGDDGNITFDCHFLGRNLIPHFIHDIYIGADKSNPLFFACLNKFGIFGKEPISGMDRIYTFCFRNFDDVIDIQICVQRTFFGVQHISLIGFCAEQRIFILF